MRTLAELEADPDLRARTARLFRDNGWRAEGNLTEFGTLLKYADAAGEVNGERMPFDPRLSRSEIAERIAQRTEGLGDPSHVLGLLGKFTSVSTLERLSSRLAERDAGRHPSGDRPATKAEKAAVEDAQARSGSVREAFERAEARQRLDRPLTRAEKPVPTHQEPAQDTDEPKSMRDSVSDAFDQLEENQ